MSTIRATWTHTIFLFFLCTIGFISNGFGQETLEVFFTENDGTLTSGRATVCEGDFIRLVTELDNVSDPNRVYNYNWRFTDSQNNNQFINSLNNGTIQNGGSGAGDEHSFLQVAVNENTTFFVQAGTGNAQIDINVIPGPDAGIPSTIFTCSKPFPIDLISFLDGTPDAGGTWTRADGSTFNGQFGAGDTPGIFTYTLTGNSPCTTVNASVTVRPCGEVDFDGDGVNNDVDLDDDNDGILDANENDFCVSGPGMPTETQFSLEEDFGVGPPTQNGFVSPLLGFYIGAPQDDQAAIDRGNPNGEYNVATSTHILNFNNQNAVFMATDLNNNFDADDNVDGRYLAINMLTSAFGLTEPIYTQTDLPVIQGIENVLSMSIASLSNNTGEQSPNLRIEIVDAVTKAPILDQITGLPVRVDTGLIPNGTDLWDEYPMTFTPPASTIAVDVRVINLQTVSGNGNDVGIDNIFLSAFECDFDQDAVANSADLDSDNDGIYDVVEAGFGNLDTDGDGRIDGGVDANGIPIAAAGGITPINSDTDSNQDYLDIDSDNDGIVDNIEGQTTAAYVSPTGQDSDFDGVDDAYDLVTGAPLAPLVDADTDGDGIPDYLDENSDDPATIPMGGCLLDTVEAYDTDLDGVADTTASGADMDNDGLDDAFDLVTLARITQDTNPTNTQTPTSFPDEHDPGGDRDWREEFSADGGANVEEDVCISGGVIDLFDFLPVGTVTTGAWTDPTTAGAPPTSGGHLGTIDPSTASDGDIHVYSYSPGLTIMGCPMRTASLEITFIAAPSAGASTTITLSDTDAPVNLIDSLGTADVDGSWTDPSNTTFGADDQGTFNPATDTFGTYTYTIGTGTCEVMATVEVIEANGTTLCSSETSFDLNTLLSAGIPTNGNWTPGNSNTINPSTLTPLDTGIEYTYTYTDVGGMTQTSKAFVTVNLSPTIAVSATAPVCLADETSYTQIFDTNGDWDITLTPNPAGITITEDTVANTITIAGIPSATGFDITVTSPTNTSCMAMLTYAGVDCSCPDLPEPTITNPPADLTICEGNAIPTLTATIPAAPAGLVGRWYYEDGTPIPGQDNTPSYTPTTAEIMAEGDTFFVEAYDPNDGCTSDRVPVTLTILQPPTLTTPANVTECEGTYSLPVLITGNYYDATGGPGVATEIAAGTTINTTQTIFIYAENPSLAGCSSEVSFNVTITPIPVATAPADFTACGEAIVPTIANLRFFTQPGGLGDERFPGEQLFDTETIYVVETVNGCSSTNDASFTITVIEDPIVDLGPDQTVCLDEFGTPVSSVELFANLDDPSLYDYAWTKDGAPFGNNEDFISTIEPGIYDLTYTLRGTSCSFDAFLPIEISTIETLTDNDIILNDGNAVSISDNTITVTVTKPGTYEYSLDDDFNYQSSNVFTKVPFGFHTVFVRNVEGSCDPAIADIELIGFPKFFTPNNDFENDAWNIVDNNGDLPDMTISIFDRYGKLLKTITPDSAGWNGTYNGRPMPATDYWFFAQLEDGTQFRSHFSLIR